MQIEIQFDVRGYNPIEASFVANYTDHFDEKRQQYVKNPKLSDNNEWVLSAMKQ